MCLLNSIVKSLLERDTSCRIPPSARFCLISSRDQLKWQQCVPRLFSMHTSVYTDIHTHIHIHTKLHTVELRYDRLFYSVSQCNYVKPKFYCIHTHKYLLYSTCVPLKIVHDCNFQLFHLRFRSSWQRLLLDAPCHVSTAHAQCVFCLRRNSESRQISPNKAKHKRKTVNHLYHGLEMASHVNFLPSNT